MVKLHRIIYTCLIVISFILLFVVSGYKTKADNIMINAPQYDLDIEQANQKRNALISYHESKNILNNKRDIPHRPTYVHSDYYQTHYTMNMDELTKYDSSKDSDKFVQLDPYLLLPKGFVLNHKEHGNYQAMVIVGHTLYLDETLGSRSDKGAIIKINLNELDSIGYVHPTWFWKAIHYFSWYTSTGQKHLTNLDQIVSKESQLIANISLNQIRYSQKHQFIYKIREYTEKLQLQQLKHDNRKLMVYAKISHSAQESPLLKTGHGESLSYNPKTHLLYLAQDSLGDLGLRNDNQITAVNSRTLRPIKQYRFRLYNRQTGTNYQIHTMTFDKSGNAYFGRKVGNGYRFFEGRFTSNSVKFWSLPQLVPKAGGTNQDLSYNPMNNKMYFVSDDAITSVPLQKLQRGSLTRSDLQYLMFNTHREFESLAFNSQGQGYLLMLWQPEIFRFNDSYMPPRNSKGIF